MKPRIACQTAAIRIVTHWFRLLRLLDGWICWESDENHTVCRFFSPSSSFYLINNYCARIFMRRMFSNLVQYYFPMNRFRLCTRCRATYENLHHWTEKETNRIRSREGERGRQREYEWKQNQIDSDNSNGNSKHTETHNISCILSEGFDLFVFVLFIHRESFLDALWAACVCFILARITSIKTFLIG